MRLGIIGSRSFDNYNLLIKVLQKYFIIWDISVVVSGGAKGADYLAERFADEHNIKKDIYYANWKLYGKGAGFKRNHEIWENSDVLVAFWDGESPGTKHSFTLADKYNKDFLVVEYKTKKIYWYLNKKRKQLFDEAEKELELLKNPIVQQQTKSLDDWF